MKLLSLWVMTICLVSSCRSSLDRDPPTLQSPFLDDSYATEYYVEDLDCQNSNAQMSLDKDSTFYELSDGAIEARNFTASDTTSTPSLRNPTIRKTWYNYSQSRDCRGEGSYEDCQKASKITSAPKSVKICKSKAFGRNSIEGVSLTSLAHLTNAREFYVDTAGSTGIASTNLLVLPKVETVLDGSRRVDTDNLAYAPEFGGAPTFVIFPKGARADQLGYWQGYSLWEIPWGLAHEYGHHIFRTHTGVKSLASVTLANGLTIDTPLHAPKFEASQSPQFSLVQKGIKDLWGATNEGFADLFAHYSLGENSDIASVDCFAKNRDINEANFADGTKKSFTSSVQKDFYDDTSNNTIGCQNPRFNDIHTIGAIIAYGVDQFLTNTEVTNKTSILLDWANRLGTRSASLDNTNDVSALLIPLVSAAKASVETIPQAACAALEDVFPLHAEAIFRSQANECL